jgi:peptidoglycan hydrolase-like protein with peptidoglycan-binding domain
MSAAGRFALFISGLVAATSLLSSRTALDATKSPGSAPVWMAVEKPPAMPVEPTVVTLAEHSEWRPVSLGLPRAPLDREAIVRQLQSELKRVGCYASEPNGIWTTSTRRAMQVFVERVNAVLPIEQPDGILLALVQGHQGKACGAPCPAGQGLSRDGRCVPNAILAMTGRTKTAAATDKKSLATTTAWRVQTTLATPAPAIEHPDDASVVSSAPLAAAAAPPAPSRLRTAEKHRRSPSVRRERGWASALFGFSFY